MDNIDNIIALRKSCLDAFKDGDYYSSISDAEKIIKLYNNYNSYEYYVDLYNLGLIYQKTGKVSMAKKIYKKIINLLKEKEFDINNKDDLKKVYILVETKNSIGICYNKVGILKLSLALSSFEGALSLARKYFKEDKNKILRIMHNIGCVYYDIEKFDEAIDYHLKELSLRNEKNTDYIDNLNFLGYDYEGIKDYKNAILYLKKALIIIKGLSGINSEEYISNLYYLGAVYVKNQDYTSAYKIYEEACNLIEQKLGAMHPYLAEALTRFAGVNIKLEKYNDALKIQLKSLSLIQKSVGENHIYYAANLKRVGDIHYLKEEYDKALPYYESETLIKKEIIGIANEEYVNSILNLINVKIKVLNDDSYIEFEQQILKLIDFEFSIDSYLKYLLILAKIYISNNMLDKVADIYIFYNKIEENVSYEEMLEKVNDVEEDILVKDFKLMPREEEHLDKEYTQVEENIFESIKSLLDDVKTEIEKYKDDKNEKDINDDGTDFDIE